MNNIPVRVNKIANEIVRTKVMINKALAGPVSPSMKTVGNRQIKIAANVNRRMTKIFLMMAYVLFCNIS